MHHYEELVEAIETYILLVIFGARNEKIIILQIKGENHVHNSAMQPNQELPRGDGGPLQHPRA